jgi:chemotaxis family two-component system response regulator Rcp1
VLLSYNESHPVEVFYIEDNKGDIRLMEEALAEANPACRLRVFTSPAPAVKALIEDQTVHPNLILLDGGLLDDEAVDLLNTVRANEVLARIPVVMFTGCAKAPDGQKCLWDRWIQKPMNLEVYFATVRDLLTLLPSTQSEFLPPVARRSIQG